VAPRPLDARSRAEALAAVSAARAAIERAAAAEKEAVGALTHAESQLATARTLSRAGAAAPNDFEHAGHEVEIRRQSVEATRAALSVARAELVRAEAAAAEPTDRAGRAVTQVRSPASGRILRVLRQSAGPVAAGTPLAELGNVDVIEVVADFLTPDAMSVKPGARATIRDWGGLEPLAARVRQVDPGAFTKVSALGVEEQRVPIVIDLVGERPAAFGNDFHVSVAIVVWTGQDVLTVPSTALFRLGESWAAFVVRDGRALLRRVTVGRSDETRSVVEKGLDAGDEVVVQPSDALQNGSRVAVLVDPAQ
jgi:HlyD family secretion protein